MEKVVTGARSAAITTAALALSSGFNFLAIFVWVRVLGPREFGVYSLVSGAALFLNAMLFEWLRVVGARTLYDGANELRIDPSRADAIFRITAIVMAGFSAFVAILWLGHVALFGVDPGWMPLVFAFAISEMALAILNVVSRVRMLAWQFFAAMVARSAVAILLGLALVVGFRLGAVGVLLGIVVAQLLTAGLIMLRDPLWRRLRLFGTSRATPAAMRETLALGLPLIASAALTYGAGIADRYLVNGALGTAFVGYYTAPADILQKTLGFLMLALNIAAYPVLVRAYEDQGRAAARKVLEDNFVAQLLLGLPAAIAFIVLAPGLSALLLGPAFRAQAQGLLPWVAVAALVRLLTSLHLLMIFQLTRRMKLMLVAPVVTLAVLVPAGLYGMHVAGLTGMAIAAVVAQLVAWAVCALLARRVFAFSLINGDVVKVIVASAAMGAALAPFHRVDHPIPVVAVCALGGAVYAAALLALRLERAKPILARITGKLRRR